MPQKILAPDNTIIEFPDNMSTQEIERVMSEHYQKQPEKESLPEKNTGLFSYFADIRDRGKAIDDSIELFNSLKETDETSNEYQDLLNKFKEANKRVEYYSQDPNWFLSLGKSIATDVAAVLGSGLVAGIAGGPVGAVAAAGTVGFERSRRQQQAFNAYRELESSGDLTREELDGAARTAIAQAGFEGLADALTAGAAGKIGKSILKKLAVDAAVGATQEVGSAMLQRGYVSNLDVFGEGSLREYFENAAAGAVAQGILGTGFELAHRAVNPDNEIPPITENELVTMQRDGFLSEVVEEFAAAEDAKVLMDYIVSNPNYLRLRHQQKKLRDITQAEETLKTLDPSNTENTEQITKLKNLISKKPKVMALIDKYSPKTKIDVEKQIKHEAANKPYLPESTVDKRPTAHLFDTPTTTLKETRTLNVEETPRLETRTRKDGVKQLGETRILDDKSEKFQPAVTFKEHKKTIEIDETTNQIEFNDAIKQTIRYGSESGKTVRSKSRMPSDQYRKWLKFAAENSDEYKVDVLPIDEVEIKNDQVYSPKNKPIAVVKEFPDTIKQLVSQRIKGKSTLEEKPRAPITVEEALKRVESGVQEIENNLLRLFGDNPNTKFTIQSMSDKALREFARSSEYKKLFKPVDKSKTEVRKSISALVQSPEAEYIARQIENDYSNNSNYSSVDLADSIIKHSVNHPDYRIIASKIKDLLKQYINFGWTFKTYIINPEDLNVMPYKDISDKTLAELSRNTVSGISSFNPVNKTGIIVLKSSNFDKPVSGTSPQVALHELIHAVTQAAIRIGNYEGFKNSNVHNAVQDLYQIRNFVVSRLNKKANRGELTEIEKRYINNSNAFHEVDEFLTWGLTDRDFQEYLDTIKLKNNTTMFDKFVEFFRKLLKLPNEQNSILNELIRVSNKLLTHDTGYIDNAVSLMNEIIFTKPTASELMASKNILNVAENATETAESILKSSMNSSAIPSNTLGQVVAKKYRSLTETSVDPQQISKQIGGKTSQRQVKGNPIFDLFNTPGLREFVRDPQALAREYPQIAEIMNLGRYIQNFKDGLGRMMETEKKQIQNVLKQKNTWNTAHEHLEILNRNNGKYNPETKTYSYVDDRGKVIEYTQDISNDIKALSDYYHRPLEVTKQMLQKSLANAMQQGDDFLVKEITNDLKRINSALSTPYFPRRRFGDLLFKIGDALYSVESVRGLDSLNIPDIEKITDELKISKKDWNQLREKIKRDHGKDIGPSAKKYFKENINGDITELTLFKRNMTKLPGGKFDDFLQSEQIINLLNEADKNKLEYFRRYASDDTLGMLLTKKKLTPGWSDDYDRLATDAHKSDANIWGNYLFKEPLKKIQKEYMSNKDPSNIAERYAEQVFGDSVSKTGDRFARIQAFLALGGNFSTAMLQTVSLMTTVPLVMSAVTNNNIAMKYIMDNVGFKLMLARGSDPNFTTNYEAIKKIAGEEFADFVTSRIRTISNSPAEDFKGSEQSTRPISRTIEKIEDFAHLMMLAAEEGTRLQSAYAMFKMFKDPKNVETAKNVLKNDARFQDLLKNRGDIPENYILTELLMDNSFGIYGRLGWAGAQNTTIGRVALPFISYPLQVTSLIIDHMKGARGKEGQMAALMLFGSMPLVYGIAGMPFYDLLEQLYSLLTSGKRRLDDDLFDAVYEFDPSVARFMKYGLVGTATNIDVSRRVALGNPFSSITSLFAENRGPVGRDVGFILPKINDIIAASKTNDPLEIVKSVSPISIQNLIKATVEYPDRGVLTKNGDVILPEDKLSSDDVLKKIMGFNPSSVANAQSSYYSALSESTRYAVPKKRLIKKAYPYYKKWIESGKNDETVKQRVLELFNDYRDMVVDNGDVFTSEKARGFMDSLLTMYKNEAGFVGGQPKASMSDDVLKRALDRYERMNG